MSAPATTILGRVSPLRRLTAVCLAVGLGSAACAEGPAVTDAAVETAIQRAVTWIKAQRQDARHWEDEISTEDRFWGGTSGLAVLALLYAGEDPRTDFMDSSLDWLSSQALRGTYTYGTRAHALALVPGTKYSSRLESDLEWLVHNVWPSDGSTPGAYGYNPRPQGTTNGQWDNSNSQYGVLGVWMATDAGLSVPTSYWQNVGGHWLRHQQPDGGWGYHAQDASTGSMTAAGLATLFVVLDRIYADRPSDAVQLKAAIQSGLTWLGREFTPAKNPFGEARWLYYYLYGVERVGRASGYKYFRDNDWFREGAAFLLEKQDPDGHWRGSGALMSDLRNTCFALMFLCHGRAPLLFNKLQHGDDWDDKLRDAAGLTHFTQRTLERLLNWQIVRLDG